MPTALTTQKTKKDHGMTDAETNQTPRDGTAISAIVKLLNETGAIGIKAALLLGVLITIGYCLFGIGYFPIGLGIGDSLLFFAIAFGFGFIHLSMCALGFVLVEGLMRLASKCSPKLRDVAYPGADKQSNFDRIFNNVAVAAFAILAALVLLLVGVSAENWAVPLVPFALSGSSLWFARVLWRSPTAAAESKKRGLLMFTLFGVVIAPVFAGHPFANWELNTVMQLYAIKAKNATLRLSDDNYATLAAASHVWQIPVQRCEDKNIGSSNVVHGVDLEWHGVGERSLISIRHASEATRSATIELKRDGLFLIRGRGKGEIRCAPTPAASAHAGG